MKKFLLGLMLAFAGALASWIFAQYKLQDETGYLQYVSLDRNSIVQLEDELFRKIKFQYKDENSDKWNDIPNISVATIQFENSSKKHIDDVEVIFELETTQGKPYSLIGYKAQGPKDYDAKYITKLNNLSNNTVGFKFNTINISSDDPNDHFVVTFLFAGDVIPKIIPKVVKNGLKIRPLNRSAEKTAYFIIFIFVYFVTIFIFLWWVFTSGKKSGKRYQDDFNEKIKIYFDAIRINGVPNEQEFVEEINKIRRESGRKVSLLKKLLKKLISWSQSS